MEGLEYKTYFTISCSGAIILEFILGVLAISCFGYEYYLCITNLWTSVIDVEFDMQIDQILQISKSSNLKDLCLQGLN